jgi:hypothetical protein
MTRADRSWAVFRFRSASWLVLPLLVLGSSCGDASEPPGAAGSSGSGGAGDGRAAGAGKSSGAGGSSGTANPSGGAAGAVTAGAANGATSGATATGGASGMTSGAGGTPNGTGGASSGGSGGSGGTPSGASGGDGAVGASGGMTETGGAGGMNSGGMANAGKGGTGASGGAGNAGTGAGGGAGQGTAGKGSGGGSCGGLNLHPFGCKLAWGIADPGGSAYSAYSYVDFMSYWVDSTISASGTYTTCNGCDWLAKIKSTNLIPVYFAYIIGYLGHSNGIVDGNQTGSKKLTTDGAQLIRDHRQQIVDAYAWYAQKTHTAWPDKPLVWLLEGDFVQYADSGQNNALSYADLGSLAADITCAIKGNMPNAVVAIDQSSWDADDVTNAFWGAIKTANVNYDLVWTTGVGNNKGYLESGTTDTTYNHATATYSYLHTLTGRTILVDTSAGASAAGDSWSTASSADLNARAAEGVIAADITGTAPGNLQSNLTTLRPSLNALSSCP